MYSDSIKISVQNHFILFFLTNRKNSKQNFKLSREFNYFSFLAIYSPVGVFSVKRILIERLPIFLAGIQ